MEIISQKGLNKNLVRPCGEFQVQFHPFHVQNSFIFYQFQDIFATLGDFFYHNDNLSKVEECGMIWLLEKPWKSTVIWLDLSVQSSIQSTSLSKTWSNMRSIES